MKLLLILSALIAGSFCQEKEIMAIKILPTRTGENYPIRVQPNNNTTFQGGFSLCVRVNFLTWDTNAPIWSKLFSLTIMYYMYGKVRFRGEHTFSWDKIIPIDPSYWNSICITFNVANLYFNLSINGKVEVSAINDKKIALEPLSKNVIDLGKRPFTGQIADLNMWSRPLSYNEVIQFSSGCDLSFVEHSKPELIFWPTAILTYNLSNAQKTKVPYQNFCRKNVAANFNFIRLPYDKLYEEHSKMCKKYNSELFFPQNDLQLQNMISYINQSNFNFRCKNIWVPFKRSKYNYTKWVYDSTDLPEKEVLFEIWKKTESKSVGRDCMFFNFTSREYVESDCDNELIICSFCQIDKSRQIFSLKHNFYSLDIDGKYYLIQDKAGDVIFYGTKGVTNIVLNEENWWMIDNIRKSAKCKYIYVFFKKYNIIEFELYLFRAKPAFACNRFFLN